MKFLELVLVRVLRGRVVLRRRLGRRLRRLREQAGMTMAVAAVKLEKDRSALQRIECGQTRADVHLVRSMMDVYDVRDDELLELAREAKEPAWWRNYHLPDVGYVALETEAAEVYAFGALSVPELVRTDAYARALQPDRSSARLRSELAARAIRRQRLTAAENPLRLHVIVDEAALTRRIGGPQVVAEQARYLAQLGHSGQANVQVMPLSAGAHEGMYGSFTVLTFTDPDDPDTLHVTYVTGALTIEHPGEVRDALTCFHRLSTQAAAPAESVRMLQHLGVEPAPEARDPSESPAGRFPPMRQGARR